MNRDGRSFVHFFASDRWETELRSHEVLFAARELLDFPDESGFFGNVVNCADGCSEPGRIGIVWHRDVQFDIVGGRPALELSFDFDDVFDTAAAVRLNQSLCPDERFHLGIQPVAHELEFAVGRNERNRPVVLEPCQPHTLVKLDVFHFYRFSTRCCVPEDVSSWDRRD